MHKLTKNGQTIYPATTTDAVAHPDLGVSASELIEEVNVSKIFPTGGIDGTNKYTLETAIAMIPASLRNVGIKCSFLNDTGTPQTWEWMGGTFTDGESWLRADAAVFYIKTRKILTDAASTPNADVIEAAILELVIFKNLGKECYIGTLTDETILTSPRNLSIFYDGVEIISIYKAKTRKVLYDEVWLFENEDARAIVDFAKISGYAVNPAASKYSYSGVRDSCLVGDRYVYNSFLNVEKLIEEQKSEIDFDIEKNEYVYDDETITGAFTILNTAISIKDGSEVDYGNCAATDFIEIHQGAIGIIQDGGIPALYNSNYGLAAYDEDKNFLQGWSGYPNLGDVVFPIGTKYIRTCNLSEYTNKIVIKNNTTLGTKDELIKEGRENIDALAEGINSNSQLIAGNTENIGTLSKRIDGIEGNNINELYTLTPFKAHNYFSGNAGEEPSYSYYQWKSVCKLDDVKPGEVYWLFNISTDTLEYNTWATLDSDGTIVRVSDKKRATRRITIEDGEASLIWTNDGDGTNGVYLKELGYNYLLHKGETYDVSSDELLQKSTNIDTIADSFIQIGSSNLKKVTFKSGSKLNIPVPNGTSFFGMWIYLPTETRRAVNSISINNAKKMAISFAMCDMQFCNLLKNSYTDGRDVVIPVTVELNPGYSEVELCLGGFTKDHITIPTFILDFDSTYTQSEDEGVYGWILDEKKLPMVIHTISGFAEATIPEDTTDWQKYIDKGQVEVGMYGGAESLRPTNFGTTGNGALWDDPYGDYSAAISAMHADTCTIVNNIMENCKHAPSAFGATQYYTNDKINYVLINAFGFLTGRLPTSDSSESGVSFGTQYASARFVYGDGYLGLNKQQGVVRNGGVFNWFNHGLSDTLAGQDIYLSFSDFKASIESYDDLREEKSLIFTTYHDYYRMIKDNDLIVACNV